MGRLRLAPLPAGRRPHPGCRNSLTQITELRDQLAAAINDNTAEATR